MDSGLLKGLCIPRQALYRTKFSKPEKDKSAKQSQTRGKILKTTTTKKVLKQQQKNVGTKTAGRLTLRKRQRKETAYIQKGDGDTGGNKQTPE